MVRPATWRGPLIIESTPTQDGRLISNPEWRELPIPTFLWDCVDDGPIGTLDLVTDLWNVGLGTRIWVGEGQFESKDIGRRVRTEGLIPAIGVVGSPSIVNNGVTTLVSFNAPMVFEVTFVERDKAPWPAQQLDNIVVAGVTGTPKRDSPGALVKDGLIAFYEEEINSTERTRRWRCSVCERWAPWCTKSSAECVLDWQWHMRAEHPDVEV